MKVLVSFSIALLAGLPATAAGQGLPKPSSSATACAYLPLPELEKHFGTKPNLVQGIDQATRHTCNATFPDPVHAASVESHPSTGADLATTAAQRLAILEQAMEDGHRRAGSGDRLLSRPRPVSAPFGPKPRLHPGGARPAPFSRCCRRCGCSARLGSSRWASGKS